MKKSNIKRNIIIAVTSAVFVFILVFCLYDSPAKFVPNQNGEIYIDNNGNPRVYYTDLFGNKFYQDGFFRVYSAVPVYISDQPVSNIAEIPVEDDN